MNNENIENIENIVFSSGDPYSSFLDKPVEIISMGQTRIGIYKGITESDDLVLYPSLSIEKSQDEKKIFWNEEGILYMNNVSVSSIGPIRMDYINKELIEMDYKDIDARERFESLFKNNLEKKDASIDKELKARERFEDLFKDNPPYF